MCVSCKALVVSYMGHCAGFGMCTTATCLPALLEPHIIVMKA